MIAVNQKQMDLLNTGSMTITSNISHILRVANNLDQHSIGLDDKLGLNGISIKWYAYAGFRMIYL